MTNTNTELQLIKSEKFGDIQADIYSIDHDYKDMYMTIDQLSKCLGYATTAGIGNIISRNEYIKSSEFSVTHRLCATDGKTYDTRLFNEDGIYEITFLSKTPTAKNFRKWVRGILKDLRSGKATLSYDNISLTPELFGKLVQRYFESMETRIMENVSKQIHGEVSDIKNAVTHSHHELLNGQKMIYNELRAHGTINTEYVKSDIKDEIISLVKSIQSQQSDKFTADKEVLSYFYTQMRNVYGVVTEQIVKDYKQKYNIDGRVSVLNAIVDDDNLASIFKNLLIDYLRGLQQESGGFESDSDASSNICHVESKAHTTDSNRLVGDVKDTASTLSPFDQLVAKRNDKSMHGCATARMIYKNMEQLEDIDWTYHKSYYKRKNGLSKKAVFTKMDVIKSNKKLSELFEKSVLEMLKSEIK